MTLSLFPVRFQASRKTYAVRERMK
jgi:hypothetical protein